MRQTILLTVALGLMAAPAFAWDNTTNGNHNQIVDGGNGTQNNNSARATASSRAASRAASTSASSAAGGSSNASGGGGTSIVQMGGNPRIVSSAEAPAYSSANPCSGSAAGGAIQTGVLGLSFGAGGGFDRVCQIATYLHDPLARAWACRHMDGVREAALDIGKPCPQDQPSVQDWAVVMDDRPDYCFTASAGEVRQHKECASGYQITRSRR